MNLNELAKEITQQEGKVKSLSIGQVKEVMKLLLTEIANLPFAEVAQLLKHYQN